MLRSRLFNRRFDSDRGISGSVINVVGGCWLRSVTCKRCTSAPNWREIASAYGIAFSDGREKSIGTRMRLNRRGRSAGLRRRGLGVRFVRVGGSSSLFIAQLSRTSPAAPHYLLNARRFLVAQASCLWGKRASRLVESRIVRQDARQPTAKTGCATNPPARACDIYCA